MAADYKHMFPMCANEFGRVAWTLHPPRPHQSRPVRASGGTLCEVAPVRGETLDLLEKVLSERLDELAAAVSDETGLSPTDARKLVAEAGGDLVESYRWQGADLRTASLDSPLVARSVLGFIRGRAVAERVGIPQGRTWDGIRFLVPAVLERAARQQSVLER